MNPVQIKPVLFKDQFVHRVRDSTSGDLSHACKISMYKIIYCSNTSRNLKLERIRYPQGIELDVYEMENYNVVQKIKMLFNVLTWKKHMIRKNYMYIGVYNMILFV